MAYELHSRALLMMANYFRDKEGNLPNLNLKLMKAHHGVLAYHLFTENKMRISAEAYAQSLFNVPVVLDANDNYWMLNYSLGFLEFSVVSKGKGINYGIDEAVEKLFSNSYFFLLNASIFESKFWHFNQKTYHSAFGSKITSSQTMGREFNFRKRRILQIGGRYLLRGGFR